MRGKNRRQKERRAWIGYNVVFTSWSAITKSQSLQLLITRNRGLHIWFKVYGYQLKLKLKTQPINSDCLWDMKLHGRNCFWDGRVLLWTVFFETVLWYRDTFFLKAFVKLSLEIVTHWQDWDTIPISPNLFSAKVGVLCNNKKRQKEEHLPRTHPFNHRAITNQMPPCVTGSVLGLQMKQLINSK